MDDKQFFKVEEQVIRRITERQLYRLRIRAVLYCILAFIGAVTFLPAYSYIYNLAQEIGAVPAPGVAFLLIMLALCIFSARRFFRELQLSRMSVV